ncbi:hypothetical protein [uncultured Sphingomonas sp.]|uniref:hypothetical protein n=1 Tax=uncultured Sphingomonas sp. TaxID=158754 RepID=UPI0025FFB9DE|nr:hypothetical protein [uncultured Sphingomonas sp.]
MSSRTRNFALILGLGLIAFAVFQLLTGGAWVAFAILGGLMLVLGTASIRAGSDR